MDNYIISLFLAEMLDHLKFRVLNSVFRIDLAPKGLDIPARYEVPGLICNQSQSPVMAEEIS